MYFISGSSRDSALQYPAHIGAWRNWSRGPIMGATLTLKRQEADFLIALTAFFVAFVGVRFWRIICFALHRIFSTANPKDVVYHQRQAILRNSSAPEGDIELLLRLFWKNRYSRQGLKLLSTALFACTCLIAFVAAGALSSRISTGVGNEVLIKSERCGSYYPSDTDINVEKYISLAYPAEVLDQAATYAQKCYLNGSFGLDCNLWVRSRLKGTVDYEASCPFDDIICRTKNGNLLMDTGYIDSNDDLGINAPADERVLWRNVLHCAPLVTAGFTSQQITPSRNFTRYHYGSFTSPDGSRDFIYSAADVKSQYEQLFSNDTITAYSTYLVNSLAADRKNETTYSMDADFEAIDELVRTDADVIVTFLSGNGVYTIDPFFGDWYRTSDEPANVSSAGATDEGNYYEEVYLPSEPASPMGCVNQYQFCSTEYPGMTGCGPLASLRESVAGATQFFNTTYEELKTFLESGNASSARTAWTARTARFHYFATMFFGVFTSLDGILAKIGSAGLLSQKTIFFGQQASLPTNQWQLDMRYLWDISLAVVQARVAQHAYGPTDDATLKSWVRFTGPEMEKMCNNQKIRSTAHGSFSLFGLLFIFVGGSIIILISYLLEPVSSFLHNRWGYKQYSHLEWTSNSMLHLQRQRMAHEEASLGTWPKSVETLQAKTPSDMLNCLDVTDASRPILRSIKKSEKMRSARTSVEAPEADISDVSASSLCETFNTLPMSVLDRSSFHAEEKVTSPRGTWGSFTTKASRSNTDPSARTEWYLDDGESSLYSQRVSFQESQAPQIVTQFDFERDVPPRGYIASYL